MWCSRFASVPEDFKLSVAVGDARAGAQVNEDAIFALRLPAEPGPVGVNVDPLGSRIGASVFPEAFPTIPGLVMGLQGKSRSTFVCY